MTYGKTNWLNIIAGFITVAIVGVGLSLSMPLLSMLFELRNIQSSLIGLHATISSAGAIAIAPMVTPLAKKLGFSKLLIFAISTSAICLLSFFWINNFWLMIPTRFIFHSAITIVIILSEFWINIEAPESKRGLILGAYATIMSMGFMIGPIILRLSNIESIIPFMSGAIIISLSLLPVLLCNNNVPKILPEEESTSFRKFFNLAPLAILGVFIFAISESGILSMFSVYTFKIGYSIDELSIFLIAMGIGNIIFQLPIGFCIDRIDKNKLFLVFALFGTLGASIIPFVVPYKLILIIIMFLWGGIMPGLYTLGLASIGSQFKGQELAAANSAFIMMYSIGMLLGPLVVGSGMDVWKPHGAIGSLALLFGVFTMSIVIKLSRNKSNLIKSTILW